MITVTDPKDKRIEEFTLLKESTLLSKNFALCESEKIYLKLIHNKIQIIKTLCLESFAKKHNLSGESIFICDRSILNSISGFKTEYDVIALFEKPADCGLSSLGNKIIALNGLTSPENVGSIVRSAAAFNVNSIVIDHKSCSPYLRRCIRVSMGNIFYMNTHHSLDFKTDLDSLKKLGYKVLSTANIAGAKDFTNYNFPEKCILIIGSEGHGVDQEILKFSDEILFIPINKDVAHLNASNAASIFLSRMNK